MARRAAIDRYNAVFGIRKGRGYSQHNPNMPTMTFNIWRIGYGLTAGSNAFVHMSQKILGQKKPCIAAAIWSRGEAEMLAIRFGDVWFSESTTMGQLSTYR